MGNPQNTLRHEIFFSVEEAGPWQSLQELKSAVQTYINENQLADSVVNLSESIYAWARGETSGVSRAQVTVWFTYPQEKNNPPRTDSYQTDLRYQDSENEERLPV